MPPRGSVREAKEFARPTALTSIVTIALTLFWRLKEWAEAAHQAESGRVGNPGFAYRLSATRSSVYGEAWRNYVAGWERLGARGEPWRDANRSGWDGVLPAYVTACVVAADVSRA